MYESIYIFHALVKEKKIGQTQLGFLSGQLESLVRCSSFCYLATFRKEKNKLWYNDLKYSLSHTANITMFIRFSFK